MTKEVEFGGVFSEVRRELTVEHILQIQPQLDANLKQDQHGTYIELLKRVPLAFRWNDYIPYTFPDPYDAQRQRARHQFKTRVDFKYSGSPMMAHFIKGYHLAHPEPRPLIFNFWQYMDEYLPQYVVYKPRRGIFYWDCTKASFPNLAKWLKAPSVSHISEYYEISRAVELFRELTNDPSAEPWFQKCIFHNLQELVMIHPYHFAAALAEYSELNVLKDDLGLMTEIIQIQKRINKRRKC